MTYNSLESLFAAICTAIRKQEGSTGSIKHQAIPERIAGLSGSSSVQGLSLNDIYIWKKTEATQKYELQETEKTNVVLSYYNPANADNWDKITYSDSIKVIESNVQLINGTEITLDTEEGGDILKGKYIYAAYTGKYYRIPEDAIFTLENPTYGTTKKIKVSTAQELTVTVTEVKGGTLVGYVVSANKENYPENGNADDGYSYEYIGTCDYELTADALTDIHIWERRTAAEKYTINETKKTDVRISYTSSMSTGNEWDEVSYSNSAEVIDSEITLVDPITITLDSSTDKKVLLGKYIYTTHNNEFYRIPEDATITRSSGTYYGSIDASTAYELSVTTTTVTGGKLVGYVVSADKEKYPENGNTSDGYKYVYIGTAESGEGTEDAVEQATPTITVSTTGLITAESVQAAGCVTGGTKTATKQLTTQAAKTYTPTTEDQEIQSGRYLTGKQTIKGDSNLLPGNIVSGITIFGKAGTHKCESTGIDTSDATATPEDMAEDVTAYVNGQKVVGSLPIWTNIYWNNSTLVWNEGKKQVVAKGTMDLRRILDKDAPIEFRQDGANYGDATAEDVAEGKTFTSSAGLKVTGTKKEVSNGVTLPTLTNPGTADDLAEGVELIDADGNVITGTVPVNPSSLVSTVASSATFNTTDNYLSCRGKLSGSRLLRDGNVTVNIAGTKLGDAEAADVAEGKTFTSVNGLKITGTRKTQENTSTGGAETFHITDADTVISPSKAGTVQVWGYGLKSSSSYSRTTYSFVGDGYYSGTSYGTPTKTSATFGIGEDGKLTGLPAGLTNLDILVVIE